MTSDLEIWRDTVLGVADRWVRLLDQGLAGQPVDQTELATAVADLRRALGLPPGCSLPPVVTEPDTETPARPGDVERFIVRGYEVPTLNRRRYRHWAQRRREKQMITLQLVQQLVQPHKPDAPRRLWDIGRERRRIPSPIPRRIHYRIFRKVAAVDEDNIIGGCKDLQDCVEAAGLIWEDSPLWLRPSYEVRRLGGLPPRVEIEIWPVPQTTWTDTQQRVVAAAVAAGEPAWMRKDRIKAKTKLKQLQDRYVSRDPGEVAGRGEVAP